MGAEIVEVDLSILQIFHCRLLHFATAEASTNLARFDGIRYGQRSPHEQKHLMKFTIFLKKKDLVQKSNGALCLELMSFQQAIKMLIIEKRKKCAR